MSYIYILITSFALGNNSQKCWFPDEIVNLNLSIVCGIQALVCVALIIAVSYVCTAIYHSYFFPRWFFEVFARTTYNIKK